jgi:hypothetical protein
MSTPHVNDFGTTFQITLTDADGVAVDVSSATTKQILFEKPDGTALTKIAAFLTDGTDGIIQWIATAGVLVDFGLWKIQGRVLAAGFQYSSEKGDFRLGTNLL